MPEIFPDDTTLLAQSEDATTGVPYIATGASPYFVEFRRMLHRLLRASERANDLRVYHAGGRLIGVRSGRCFVGQQARSVAALEPLELDADDTTHIYLDTDGVVQLSTAGLPADRATFIPLAQAVTDANTVVSLVDLRGEAILQAQTAALAGITATAEQISLALDGASTAVTAENLNTLTAGSESNADALHRHTDTVQDVDGEAVVALTNLSADPEAAVALGFLLPNLLPDAVRLVVDPAAGALAQRHLGVTRSLVGSATLQHGVDGAIPVGVTTQLVGVVPIAGEVVAVVLSCGANTESDVSADGISAGVRVNGNALTTTDPALTSADGAGFASTDQAAGTAAAIDAGGVATVARGDIVTVQWTYNPTGTVTQPPRDAAVLVVIRAAQPE
ncbi:MAG: hypothetical protein ACIAXF_09855 [Phycisphaerales bacterium JB063]